MSTKPIISPLIRRPKLSTVVLLIILGVFSSGAVCSEAQERLLSAVQVQERLTGAGYGPLWLVERNAVGYTVEGIDPTGNPVVLGVDAVTASIVTLESLALLK